ncbi:MAG: transcriptional regulator [Ornithinibacter sp.]
MGDLIHRRELETAEQREAMRHPTRHRITLALREPMTVSDLARELHINKGNVAHHVAVLKRVGLLERVGSRTGRGGTGVLYRSGPLRLSGREATTGMMQTVTDAVVADPDAFALLRTVRVTASQARYLTEHLEQLVLDVPAQPGAERHLVFVSVANA